MSIDENPYPYRHRRRPGKPGKRRLPPPKKKAARFSRPQGRPDLFITAVLVLAGFFLGRAQLLGELMPFGPALVAAAVRTRRQTGVWVTLAVLGGIASRAGAGVLPGYITAVVLIFVLLNWLPVRLPRPWLVVPGIVAAAWIITRTAFTAFTAPSTYAYMTIIFEAVFAAVLTQLFVLGIGPLVSGEKRALTPEELFSLLVLLAGVLAGTGSYTFGLVSLRGVVSRFLVLLAAFLGGPGLGAAVGALAGVIPGLTFGTTRGLVDAYAFVGLVAGLCQGFGRVGVGVGFLLGSIVLSVYTSNFTSFTTVLAESGVALAFYLAFPESLAATLRLVLARVLPAPRPEDQPPDRARNFLARQVHGWADILHQLSRAFGEMSAGSPFPEESRVQTIIDQVAATICQGCSLHQTCWEKEFYHTFQNILDLAGEIEARGDAPWRVSGEMKRRCPRQRELGIALVSLYASSRAHEDWDRKLRQERDVVAIQMEALGGMLENLATRVEEADWEGPPLPGGVAEKLAGKGVRSLTLEGTGGDRPQVLAVLSPCAFKADCWQEPARVLREHLGTAYHPATRQCLYQEGDLACRIRLYPELRFHLSLGVAVRAREGNDVSGDAWAIEPLPGGRLALMLSDGMGAGPAAAEESRAALGLLTELLRAGFPPEVAVRTVNATLLMQKSAESFTTIDLAIVDLYDGEAAFIKVGAPPGFVRRPKRVAVIQANSLPAGILKDIDVTTSCRTLAPGDYLVLATDGVHDAHPDGGQDLWLAPLLQEMTDVHPRELADLILNLASRQPARDDQAVLAARLEEN